MSVKDMVGKDMVGRDGIVIDIELLQLQWALVASRTCSYAATPEDEQDQGNDGKDDEDGVKHDVALPGRSGLQTWKPTRDQPGHRCSVTS